MVFREVWVEDKGGAPGERVIYQHDDAVKADAPCSTKFGITSSETRDPGFPSGRYRFELYADGQLLKSVPFIIKK